MRAGGVGLVLSIAAVLGSGLGELWVALRPGLAPVPAAALAAARREVDERRLPGTLLVHSPLFGVAELAALGDLPARPDFPDPDTRRGRRLIVIDRADAPIAGLGEEDERVLVDGAVVLRLFEPRGQAKDRLLVFDLRDALGPRTLSIERPRGQVVARCSASRPEGGFACPGQPEWLYAASRRLRVDGREVDCVWAHPTAGGVVVYEVPAPQPPAFGHRLELELAAALADGAVQTPNGAAVTTRVVQDGRPLGQVVRTNATGWARGRYTVRPEAPIRLEVTAPRDGVRHHCLDARVVEVAEGGGS